MTYRIAGIDNFQQSGRNTSLPSRRKRYNSAWGFHIDGLGWPEQSRRVKATTRDMEPLSSSVMSTAAAAEYVSDGAADTRE